MQNESILAVHCMRPKDLDAMPESLPGSDTRAPRMVPAFPGELLALVQGNR
jgi:hypothetical protein